MQETIQPHKKIFLQATGLMSLAVILGYPLSYLRDLLVIKLFGASAQTDAWLVASQIPELCYKFLMFGALGVSFMPVFAEYLMQKKEQEAWEIASTVINATALLLALVAGIGVLCAGPLVKMLVPGFARETYALTVALTRVVIPVGLFTGIMGLLTGIYRVHLRFILPAVVNLVGPLTLIIFLIAASSRIGIFSLAFGTLAGAFLGFVMLCVSFFIRRPAYRLVINFRHPAIKRIFLLMVPLVGADLLSKGGVILFQVFASFLKEGSITSFVLAYRVVSVPVIIFSSAATSVLFPLLSRHSAEGDTAAFKETVLMGTKFICMLFIPASVGFMVLGEPIIRLLFQYGLFDAASSRLTGTVLVYLSAGLVAYGLTPILQQACYALKKNWLMFRYEIIGLCLTVPLYFLFMRFMGLAGLGVVTALVRIILSVYLLAALARHTGGLDLKSILPALYKIMAASAVMGAVCFGAYRLSALVFPSQDVPDQILKVGGTVSLAAAVYCALLVLFKEPAVLQLRQIAAQKFPWLARTRWM